MDLIAYAKARMKEYQSYNARMLRAVKGLNSVAQVWGLHDCITDNCALKFVRVPRR